MKKIMNRLLAGVLSLAAVFTTLPVSQVQATEKQYWTESAERVGMIEKVMNDGSIGSTFNEGMMKVEGETAYCVDINTNFQNVYKTRADASTRMSADQIAQNGLTCCGWCAARHASINPSYLTEGYKSTGNNQTTGQNPTVHKGFPISGVCQQGSES